MSSISPFLWFGDKAEEAAKFYVSIFKNSKITNVSRYGEAGPMPEGTAMVVEFELDGLEFMALNGGQTGEPSDMPPAGAIALYVDCPAQADVDNLWDKLLEGGETMQCGWLRDRFGVVWNIVPSGLKEYIGGDDPEGAKRAMDAMMKMVKLDINELRRAYEGK